MGKRYKILATKEQLYDIGIDENISGLVGVSTHEFQDGWRIIEFTKEESNRKYSYDIPEKYLELEKTAI